MASAALDEVWELFSIFDIPHLYSRYAVGVDFLLALLFFLGVTKSSIGKRFTGRAGTLLTVAVSLFLSVGFSVAEAQLGFNLAAFGPIAMFFIFFVVALVLYQLSRSLGCHVSTAVSLSFVMVYLSIQAFPPSVMDFVHQRAPWLRTTLFFIFIFSAGKLLYSILFTVFSKSSLASLSSKIAADPEHRGQLEKEIKSQKQEVVASKKQEKLSRKNLEDSGDILESIASILQILETEDASRDARTKIADKLYSIAESEHQIEKRIKNLENVNAKLKSHDSDHFNQLKEKLKKAQGEEKNRLQEEVNLEQEKLRIEQAVKGLTQRIPAHLEQLTAGLRSAAEIIGKSPYPLDAKPYLQKAMHIEEEIRSELSTVGSLEVEIEKLAKREKNALKRRT